MECPNRAIPVPWVDQSHASWAYFSNKSCAIFSCATFSKSSCAFIVRVVPGHMLHPLSNYRHPKAYTVATLNYAQLLMADQYIIILIYSPYSSYYNNNSFKIWLHPVPFYSESWEYFKFPASGTNSLRRLYLTPPLPHPSPLLSWAPVPLHLF